MLGEDRLPGCGVGQGTLGPVLTGQLRAGPLGPPSGEKAAVQSHQERTQRLPESPPRGAIPGVKPQLSPVISEPATHGAHESPVRPDAAWGCGTPSLQTQPSVWPALPEDRPRPRLTLRTQGVCCRCGRPGGAAFR